MKKINVRMLLVLIGVLITSLTTPTWGKIAFTVGVTGTGSSSSYGGSDYNKMKLNARWQWDGTDKGWSTTEMTKAGVTFEGKDLWIVYAEFNDAAQTSNMQFQKYKNSYQVYSWDAYAGKRDGDYWNSRIVAYGGSRYDQKNNLAGAHFYFDASNWSQTGIKLVVGHTYYQYYYAMSHVENTKLYYLTTSKYDNFAGLGVVGGTNRANGGHSEQLTNVSANASEYTGWKNYDFRTTTDNSAYLMVNNGKAGQEPTMSIYSSSFYSSGNLNFDQTIQYVLRKDGGAYTNMSSGKTPAKISMSSYKFVSGTYDAVSAVNPTAMSLGGTTYSTSFTAARTATTTVTVSNIDPGYVFDGWYDATTGGNLLSSNKSYTYYPTAVKTVYARFTKVYGFIEGKFAVRNAARNSISYTASNGSWVLNSTNIPMSWDETNHRLYVHTYSTPTELKAQINSNDPWFIVKTSSSSSSVDDNGAEFWAAANTDAGKKLTAAGRANGKAIGSTSGSFTFLTNTGTTGYAIIYCDSSTIWYELEYMLEYDANGATSGSIPTGRTYHLSGTTPTAATNSGSLSKTGYDFNGWSTTSGVEQTPTYAAGATMSAMSADVKLYVAWAAQTYNIVYKDQGNVAYSGNNEGSLPDTHTYNIATALVDGSKTGYNFEGWYTTSACSGDPVTSLGATDYTSDITLYAKWTIKSFDGTIDKTTGSSNGSYSVTYMATSLTPSAPTKSGYHVTGYYLSYSNEGEEEFDYKISDANGNLQPNVTYAATSYTNPSSNWIYDGDAPTIYAKWAGNSHTLKLYKNDGTEDYASTSVTVGSNSYSISAPTRTGYTFAGFYTAASGGDKIINTDLTKPVSDYFDASSNWKYDGNVNLYAHWTPVDLTFSTAGSWSTPGNWSPACVPTSEHDVTISAAATIEDDDAVAKSVTIASGGSITIASTGVLEVAGTITNTDASKLVINSTSSSQGALIYDISSGSQPYATVNMTTSKTGGDNFQYIASPIGGASVMSTFAGKGVYTYAWVEGKGWDRRGYYEDFSGSEVIVLNGQSSCSFAGQLYPSTGGSLAFTATPENDDAQGVNMIPNTLTAPIKIAAMTITNSTDGSVHIWNNGAWSHYATGSAGEAVIPALQGYAVIAEASGSVSFAYNTAVRGAASHNDALKAPKRTNSDIQNHITISVTTDERKVDLQLYEHEQFTNAIDKGWEAIYMDGDGRFGELYAQSTEKMSIFAVPDLEGTVLGFVQGETLNYTISFEGNGKGYYLNDMVTEQSTLIDEDNTYVFSSSENNAARFIISKTPIHNMPTDIDNVQGNNVQSTKARKQIIDGKMYIIRGGRIYSAQGALVK